MCCYDIDFASVCTIILLDFRNVPSVVFFLFSIYYHYSIFGENLK
jgi:hypothetical protein